MKIFFLHIMPMVGWKTGEKQSNLWLGWCDILPLKFSIGNRTQKTLSLSWLSSWWPWMGPPKVASLDPVVFPHFLSYTVHCIQQREYLVFSPYPVIKDVFFTSAYRIVIIFLSGYFYKITYWFSKWRNLSHYMPQRVILTIVCDMLGHDLASCT